MSGGEAWGVVSDLALGDVRPGCFQEATTRCRLLDPSS